MGKRWTIRNVQVDQLLAVGGASSVWASLLLLLKHIFDNNFTYRYVLEHSAVELAAELKLSVLWTGQEGSYLLWASLVLLFYVLFRRVFTANVTDTVVHRSFLVASIFCLALVLLMSLSNPFALSTEVPQDGWSLNPLLRTPWNIFHPPVVFIGYAAAVIPASIAVSRMTVRQEVNGPVTKKLSAFLNLQMAVTWTFLTLGIIVGGYWAYVTLGWGGYWAWDPVETTSLISWLFCTAFFHGKGLLDPRSLASNTLVFFTLLSVFFATFITRSGVVSSVHGFADSPITLGLIVIIMGSLIAFATLMGYQLTSRPFSLDALLRKVKGSRLVLALLFSVVSIVGLVVVSFVGIMYPTLLSAYTGIQHEIDPSFFNRFSFPFAIGLTVSTFLCTFPSPRRSPLILKLMAVGLGVGFVLMFLGVPTTSSLANFLIPLAVLGLLFTGARVIRDFHHISAGATLLKTSSHTILHLGLTLILLGVLISSNTKVTAQGWHHQGSFIPLNTVTVEMNEIALSVENPSSYTVEGRILVFDNGGLMGGGYAYHVVEPGWGSFCRILIVSNPVKDVYVSLHNIQLDPITGAISQAYIEASVIELVSLVWIGCFITAIAILTMLVVSSVTFVQRRIY
jgi:cytochrome c-type biogenesis protein CcmF